MKWYVIVEGRHTEKKIYRAWIGHAFPGMCRAERIEDMQDQCYYLIIGAGYPSCLQRIADAVADIQEHLHAFDRLVICVDAEEMAAAQRRSAIEEHVSAAGCPCAYTVVVQNCCIETWLLGHSTLMKRTPQEPTLLEYQQFYDVRTNDPEAMPAMPPSIVRAQFHYDYVRAMFRERQLSYTKKQPGHACDRTYLEALVKRVDETSHLRSLAFLIDHWRSLGSRI